MNKSLQFLSDGGEMGELIRSFDWSKTALGSPETWSQSLRVAVRIMLDCPFGMYIAWGNEFIQLYNDGYRPILGSTKHPQALGISTRQTFAEIWTTIGPMFEDVMQGTPVGFPDFVLHLNRNEFVEECVFDFSYSPIRLENGEVGGVLVTVIETTKKVNNFRKLTESNDQLNFAIYAAEIGTWDYNLLTNKFTCNNHLKDWFGLPEQTEYEFSSGMNIIADKDRVRVEEATQNALQYQSGGEYDIEYTIIHPITKQERMVKSKGRAWFGEDKIAYRLNGTLQDITQENMTKRKIEDNEKRFSNVLSQSIMAIGILEGPNSIVSFANDSLLEMWRKDKSIIGKTLLEALPEIKDQGFPELIIEVYNTGVPYEAFETKATLMRNGIAVEGYFNFIYQPYRDIDNNIIGITVFATEVTEQVLAKKQIEMSEKRFTAAVEAMQGILWTNNAEGKMEGEQKPWAALTGQSYEEYQGYGWATAVHPDDAQPTIDAWNEAIKETKNFVFEHRVKTKTGKYEMFSIKAVPLLNEDNSISEWVGVHTNINEQKEAEGKIKQSEAKIRNFILQAPVAMCLYRGPEHIIEIVNDELLSIWDKPLDSVINKPVFEAIPEAKNQGFEALLNKVYATGEQFTAPNIPLILSRNGKPETIHANFVYQAFREMDGTISGVVEVVSNVTEQVLATQQIKESENQFRTFANSIQNLAWIANANGWIYWYNQQWYDYTGTTLEEMQGWGWDKVHDPDHIERVVEFVKTAWQKDEAWELTFPLRKHSGEYRWFITRAYPVKDISGNIERWIGTNTDITEQKSFVEELEIKVNERTAELLEKNITLENANAELASFSYIASHDLQEPLRKIQTFSNRILEKEIFSNETQHYFNRIISASERMRNLITSLLDYSRTNTTELIFKTCDLNRIVEESKSDLDERIFEKKAIIEYQNLPVINGVSIQIAQLFTNLIDNAIKYSRVETNPYIKITASMVEGRKIEHSSANNQKEYHAIKIADNGIGFEKEQANKVFELFQRLHHKDEYSGTGIGLAIVKKIVNNHNGFITAEGQPGIGSTFTIYIPTT